ncbi:hypothetical protein RND81_14G197100 [Saponaria officinalis]|uniref:Tim44-like domain-containing protein n=1 Tax=Saponaria officinalis TaxID=3572 RepID=A0AAW1GP55_SAPOF
MARVHVMIYASTILRNLRRCELRSIAPFKSVIGNGNASTVSPLTGQRLANLVRPFSSGPAGNDVTRGKFDDAETQKEMKMVPYKIIRAPNGDYWFELNGRQYYPSQIGAFYLTKLKETAKAYLGKTVSKAAYFNDAQRQATKDAARMARLDAQSFIDEYTATALSYDMSNEKRLIVIFRLGGGTIDASIYEFSNGVLEVEAIHSDVSLFKLWRIYRLCGSFGLFKPLRN